MIRSLPALVLLGGLVAACGSDDAPQAVETPSATVTTVTPSQTATPTPTPTPTPTTPTAAAPKPKPKPAVTACGAIWKVGATLPVKYNGCPEEAGESSWEVEECYSGGKYATFWSANGATRYAAKLGGPIYKKVSAAGDDDYGYVLGECTND